MDGFANFSDEAKIWIFQSNKQLDDQMKVEISSHLKTFCADWTSHGAKMKSTFSIEYDRFVVVALDESLAVISGCGQDKLIHAIQEIGKMLNIDFFDRLQTLYLVNYDMKEARLHEFWALRKAEVISNETLVFDNTVKNLGEWRTKWVVPFAGSWHAEMWGK